VELRVVSAAADHPSPARSVRPRMLVKIAAAYTTC